MGRFSNVFVERKQKPERKNHFDFVRFASESQAREAICNLDAWYSGYRGGHDFVLSFLA